MSPEKKRVFNSLNLNKVRTRLNRIAAHKRELDILRQKYNAIGRELEKSLAVYNQLIRRLLAVYKVHGINVLGNQRLTQREINVFKKITRATKEMSVARRTVKRLPIPQNIGDDITRLTAILSVKDPL